MYPLWPSIVMSSTLVRLISSFFRSRPMGLPRNQLNENQGPEMLPFTSH
jgi:hypothetical protein